MKKFRLSSLRWPAILLFLALTAAGLARHTGWGTLSAFGWDAVAAVCPLGGLEALAAGRSLSARAVIGICVSLAFIVLLGRVFCGWVCPAPLVKRIAGGRSAVRRRVIPIRPIGGGEAAPSRESLHSKAPYWILGGAIASSAVFGFPVFCLVCPAGLTFAILIGAWRLFQFNIGGWAVVFFIAVLALELLVLRRWCHRLCPLGALVSLVSRLNLTFRPVISEKKCLRAKGLSCNVCLEACPEAISLPSGPASSDLSRCTKCRACADACPENAIAFPLFGKQKAIAPQSAAAAEKTAAPLPAGTMPAAGIESARSEASRCMMCGECQSACPMGNVIPLWMAELREGRPRSASRLMLGPGALPEICSRVCPSERLCESVCSRSGFGGAIRIHEIEREAADKALRRGSLPRRIRKTGKKAAVIGAGPAGLACADVLLQAGIAVTVYDRNPEAGGLLTFGIPEKKLPKALVQRRRAMLEDLGAEFRLGTEVGKDVSFESVRGGCDAVFIGCGSEKPVALEIPGADAAGVAQAISLLRARAFAAMGFAGEAFPSLEGKRVLVLGGGDTAADAARAAADDGAASVTIAYRRDEACMKISKAEAESLRKAGVRFVFGAVPARVETDAAGRASGMAFEDGSSFECDTVLVAFGFRGTPVPALEAIGARYDEKGRLLTKAGTLETDAARVWAGGDAVRGADLVVRAVADGRAAGLEMVRALTGKSK